jgi:rhombotail lipoprotein
MKNIPTFSLGLLTFTSAILLLTGCDTFQHRSQRQATSVVNYLYPNQAGHIEKPAVPVLKLPLSVGVAFVPEDTSGQHHASSAPLTESQRVDLINRVSESFRSLPFVRSIEVFPSAYLTSKGGFANLDQIRSMHGVDLIALLSYDQVQFTDEGLYSLTYWTLVGAYVVRGEHNDTQTMLDAAVFDIASRKLLFRAPGTSKVKNSSTPINQTEQLRKDRLTGFQQASTNMVASLHTQLEAFRVKVKQAPDEIKIVRSPGYTGDGSLGGLELGLVVALVAVGFLRRKREARV